MKMNQDRAIDFAKSCYETLSSRMKLPKVPLNVDIKDIWDRREDIAREQAKAGEIISQRRFIYDCFGGSMPDINDIMPYVIGGIFQRRTTASYQSDSHTIHITLYNDINSLMKFDREMDIPTSTAPKVLRYASKKAPIWIASELGHALRAVGAGYAGRNELPDTFIAAKGNDNRIGLLNFDDLKSGKKNHVIRDEKLMMLGTIDMSEFFEPIGVFECESLAKGTENEFANDYDLEFDANKTSELMRKARADRMRGVVNIQEALICDKIISHQASFVPIAYYKECRDDFRKYVYADESIFKWSPERVIDKFFKGLWEVL